MFIWAGFLAMITAFLALDLGVFHRRAHVVGIREAFLWTTVWVILAMGFTVAVYFMYGHHWLGLGLEVGHELSGRQAAEQFLTGYIIEKSLSLDNIFVIALIFSYFGIPAAFQHRVLFWGILGAVAMRGAMIVAGAALLRRFDWVAYILGLFLLATAVKMLIVRHDNLEPEKNPLVRLARRFLPFSENPDGDRFFTRLDGKRAATPLFLVLLLVESADVLFAVDSVPAIFAITRDPFLVFTSNVFAILGLRSLYFALAGAMSRFRYLKMSLVFVLAFVGIKMLLSHHHQVPAIVSLLFIIGILAVGIVASVVGAKRDTARLVSPLEKIERSKMRR
ncbi:MAG: TerC family protein [Candidatus Krumholzibacteria bacterium]|nr:TerC family protein [Candidatus Krumholzibacteria bacterium]